MLIFFWGLNPDMSLPGRIKTQQQLFGEAPDNNVKFIHPQMVRDICASFEGYIGTIDPSSIDDNNNTHGTGSFDYNYLWLNKTNNSIWCCTNPASGAAQWAKIYPQVDSSGLSAMFNRSPYIGMVDSLYTLSGYIQGLSGQIQGLTPLASGAPPLTEGEVVLIPDRVIGSEQGPWVASSGTWYRPSWWSNGQLFSGSQHVYVSQDDLFVRGDWNVADELRNNGIVGTDTSIWVGAPHTVTVAGSAAIEVSKTVNTFTTDYDVSLKSATSGGGISSGLIQSGAIDITGQSGIIVNQLSPSSWKIGSDINLSGLLYSGAINQNYYIYAPAFSGYFAPAAGYGATNVLTHYSGNATNNYTTIFTASDANGLHGVYGLVASSGLSNPLDVRATTTDMWGRVNTTQIGIGIQNGAALVSAFDDDISAGLSIPPYFSVQVEVRNTNSGTIATYDAYKSQIG